MSSKPQSKISFLAKDASICPVCKFEFHREQLRSGGGRLNAGDLTIELRRLYIESSKFGKIYPLAFEVVTCPKCLFSALKDDFSNMTAEEVKKLRNSTIPRQQSVEKIFGKLDFSQPRNLILGTATFMLAVDCYHFRVPEIAPTPKKAVSAIRAAWLFGDIFKEFPDKPFDKVSDFYYMKALEWYKGTLDIMQTNDEPIDVAVKYLGPDTDKNWSFDGVMYLNGYLTVKYIDRMETDKLAKAKILIETKKFVSKLYGSGKSTKSKPQQLIDMAKEVFDSITKMIEELGYDPNNYDLLKNDKT